MKYKNQFLLVLVLLAAFFALGFVVGIVPAKHIGVKLYSVADGSPFLKGMVVPASCESAYEHFTGQCAMANPSCVIAFSPAGITHGQTTAFSWQYSDTVVRYDNNCTGDLGAGSGHVPPIDYSGSFNVSPNASQTCTNTVYDASNNSANCSAMITVNPPGGCPPGQNDPHTVCQGTSCVPVAGCGVSSCSNDNQCGGGGGQQQNQGGGATITAAPSSITEGQSTQLSWVYQGQGACSIDQGIGSVANSGSVTVSPTSTITYTITCGAASAHVTVLVSGKPKFKEVVPE